MNETVMALNGAIKNIEAALKSSLFWQPELRKLLVDVSLLRDFAARERKLDQPYFADKLYALYIERVEGAFVYVVQDVVTKQIVLQTTMAFETLREFYPPAADAAEAHFFEDTAQWLTDNQ